MTTKAETGTLFSTGGDESWPVRYRVTVVQPHDERSPIAGTLEFPARTRLRTLSPQQPVYLRLRDGRWARVHFPVEPPDQTSYTLAEGSRLEAPSWVIETMREGETFGVGCPDCGGDLRADKQFVLRRGESLTNPIEQTPFWSMTCLGCGHRFNYTPKSGRLDQFA